MAFQGVSVGIAAADADLWGFCGDARRLTSAIRPGFGEARRCLMRSPRGTAADPARTLAGQEERAHAAGLRRVPELPRFVWHVTNFRCVTEALACGA